MRIVEALSKLKLNKTFIAVIGIIFFELLMYILTPYIHSNIKIIIGGLSFAIIVGYIIYLHRAKDFSSNKFIYVIIILGILIRTMYVIYTPITIRQHDVEELDGVGHLGYINTIYETGKLPESREWQFYHPPLFHFIGSTWLHINDAFNVPFDISLEGLQFLTLFFSSVMLLVFYKIINYLKIDSWYKIIINMFLAFFPTFVILAGSINNDCLLVLLQALTILYLIKFNEEMSYKNTIFLALFIGLAAMTKISGVIIAIPILFIFIKKLVYSYKNKKLFSFFKKMTVFALIALPIGLWYQIRLIVLFKGFSIPDVTSQIINNYGFISRFLTISFKQIFYEIYCEIPGDYNLFAYLVKCSIFGEYSYKINDIYALSMLVLNFFIIVFSLFATIYYAYRIFKTKGNENINILFNVWIVNIISFIIFNIRQPFTCSMDYRYIPLTCLVGIVLICYLLNNLKIEKIKDVFYSIILLFNLICFLFFFLI